MHKCGTKRRRSNSAPSCMLRHILSAQLRLQGDDEECSSIDNISPKFPTGITRKYTKSPVMYKTVHSAVWEYLLQNARADRVFWKRMFCNYTANEVEDDQRREIVEAFHELQIRSVPLTFFVAATLRRLRFQLYEKALAKASANGPVEFQGEVATHQSQEEEYWAGKCKRFEELVVRSGQKEEILKKELTKAEKTSADLEQHLIMEQRQKDILQNKCAETIEQCRQMDIETKELKNCLQTLSDDYRKAREQIRKLEVDKETLHDKLRKAKNILQEQEGELAFFRSETSQNVPFGSHVEKLKSNNDALKKRVEDASKETDKFKTVSESLQKTVEHLTTSVERSVQFKKADRLAQEELKRANDQLQQQNRVISMALDQEKQRTAQLNEMLREQHKEFLAISSCATTNLEVRSLFLQSVAEEEQRCRKLVEMERELRTQALQNLFFADTLFHRCSP